MSETANQQTAPDSSDKTKQPDKVKTVNVKKDVKKKPKTAVDELTAEEREAVTIVFHQFETGLREGTIFTKVRIFSIILLASKWYKNAKNVFHFGWGSEHTKDFCCLFSFFNDNVICYLLVKGKRKDGMLME